VPELEDLRNRAGVFEYVTGAERGSVDFTGGAQPERLELITASPNYFAILGVTPQIGRLFGPQDKTLGFAPSAVISDSLWRRDFAGNINVLGPSRQRSVHHYWRPSSPLSQSRENVCA
jgi:putative ABC transport system permease protein